MSNLAMPSDLVPATATATAASACAGLVSMVSPLAAAFPAAVVFLSFTGAAAGLLVRPPAATRRRMFALTFAYTAFAAALAIVLAAFPLSSWLKPVAPAAGLLLAFLAQVIEPALGRALEKRIQRTIGGDP